MVKKIVFIVLSVIFIMLGVYSCSEGSNYFNKSKIAGVKVTMCNKNS